MKNQRLFIGTLLIGIGGFFLLDSLNLPFAQAFLHWPIILIIIGIAFLVNGTIGKEQHALFPGVLLFGLGFHFFAKLSIPSWPDSWGMYTLIIGIAFLFQKNAKFTTAFLLIGISIIELFYSDLEIWKSVLVTYLSKYWPLILIGFGVYFMFFKKK